MSVDAVPAVRCWGPALVSRYEQALHSATSMKVHDDTGAALPFDTARWLDGPDAADESLLARCTGPTIDVGCGPGRLVRALTARGIPALGVDVSGAAVALARSSGAMVLRRSVFERLPGAGRWQAVLLADGNIGIGGNTTRLLVRLRELLAPRGQVLVEVEPGHGVGHFTATVTGPSGETLATFPWARIGAGPLTELAAPLGYVADEHWSVGERQFVGLRRC
ncbi:MAG TPA: class I SAM-dependent methyltransferase [Sporichthya sp.]|nr:class I SAM-dependent methyltransferase [Sporichthya sp.]